MLPPKVDCALRWVDPVRGCTSRGRGGALLAASSRVCHRIGRRLWRPNRGPHSEPDALRDAPRLPFPVVSGVPLGDSSRVMLDDGDRIPPATHRGSCPNWGGRPAIDGPPRDHEHCQPRADREYRERDDL